METHAPVHRPFEDVGPGPGLGLSELLRERTRSLHVAAERSGIIRELLRGGATRAGHTLLLRNLLPAYQQLESGLVRHHASRGVGSVVRPSLYRAAAIESDLKELAGPQWRQLVFLPEGENYASRIAAAAEGNGAGLLAHSYVRYLGDLSGGQILKRLLARSLGLGAGALSFYDFPDITDISACRDEFRVALDRCAQAIGDPIPVIDEAMTAFRLNIALSEAVYAAERG